MLGCAITCLSNDASTACACVCHCVSALKLVVGAVLQALWRGIDASCAHVSVGSKQTNAQQPSCCWRQDMLCVSML